MSEPRMNQSDEAVRDATGRTWAGWEAALDEAGGEALSHRDLVAWLGEHGGVESSWRIELAGNPWCSRPLTTSAA